MKNLKRIMVLAMTFVLVLTGLTACGKTTAKKLTKDEYIAEVTRIYTGMNTKAEEIMSTVDLDTTEGKAELVKKIMEQITPILKELGAINAPDEFKEEQEKIKKGTEAMIEVLKYAHDDVKVQEVALENQQALTDYDAIIRSIVPQEEPTTGEATTAK